MWASTKIKASKAHAYAWHQMLWAKYHVQLWLSKYKWKVLSICILILIGLNIGFLPKIDPLLVAYFPGESSINNLKSALISLGGALIGAAFIAFSLIMFSTQVNIERMPHGLFFRFGKDVFILLLFVATLLSGIAICFSSTLLFDVKNLSIAVSIAFWGVITIISFVIRAYERTLFLINPVNQLNMLIELVEKDLKSWERRAEKAKPLLGDGGCDHQKEGSSLKSTHDIKRTVYQQRNPHGKHLAQNAIDHAFSFFQRYAERGDYVVSAHALQTVSQINHIYVLSKGKTFFSSNLWIENPYSSDELITHSLESLRRSLTVAIGRMDEQQATQILQTISQLANIYLNIDYSDQYASKSHANLAAYHLGEAVTSILAHEMTDVVMEGVRLMGGCVSLISQHGKVNDTVALIDKIGMIALVGIGNKKNYPITVTAIQQLSNSTMVLLRSKPQELSFVFKTIKRNVSFVSEMVLKLPSIPIENSHSIYLAPYYSCQPSNLSSMMANLANAVLDADADNEDAKRVIGNFTTWSDQIFEPERKLFKQAIEAESDLLFHHIEWTITISEILVMLSNTPACEDYIKEKLQKNALRLISNLSWVPDDEKSVSIVSNYQFHETLFDAALTGYHRDCKQYLEAACECLLDWAFKGGRLRLGRGTLELSLNGLAVLALLPERDDAEVALIEDIKKKISSVAIFQEDLDNSARELRERAATLYRIGEYTTSKIEVVMKQIDAEKMQNLLTEIANVLSPNTADEEVNISIF